MDPSLVQPVTSTNAAVPLSTIIPEVLKNDNYERWSILMQHYLVAQGLWDVVLSSHISWAEDSGDWIKRNASALFAIKISCGAESFDQIKNMNLAKDAWNALADLHKPPNVDERGGSETDAGILDHNERTEFVTLLKDIYDGDWNALKSFDRVTEIIFPGGFTVLHVATIAGHLKIVNELVKIVGGDYLETQDDNGDTALSLAACNGQMQIAKCLVQKNHKALTITNNEGYIPLVVASFNRKREMSSYLYSITPFDFLLPGKSNQGTLFLKYCVLHIMFDVGLDLFRRCPPLAATTRASITISELSIHRCLFPGRAALQPFHQFLYKCLCFVKLPSPSEGTISELSIHRCLFPRRRGLQPSERFLYKSDWDRMYNLRLTHMYANSVLQYWCKEISTYRDATQLVESGTISAIFQAIKNGTVEIVIHILKANPDLIWCNKKLSRNILISAIKHRREDIVRFVSRLDAGKKTFLSLGDENGNNVLHLVAKLPDRQTYNNLYPAWAMEREVKWFQEFISFVPHGCQGAKNIYGETPAQVFQREHQQLMREASDGIKKTADSYILVPVLIVTIMFAALFTVPGGNNQETGMPILSHRKLFLGFLICDAVSLFTASTSMLSFLGIRLYTYSTLSLRQILPVNLMGAICLLVISIATMLLAFIFALTIMLQKKRGVIPAIITYVLLSFIPMLFGWICGTLNGVYKRWFQSIIFKREDQSMALIEASS